MTDACHRRKKKILWSVILIQQKMSLLGEEKGNVKLNYKSNLIN